jgi:UDP-N-acetylglucosamine 2-epimerase (non-hydrolysing)
VIKLAPVVRAFAEDSGAFDVRVVAVEQQGDLLHRALEEWGITPDRVVSPAGNRANLAAALAGMLPALYGVIEEERPDYVMVQGDTLTAFAAALAASYAKKAVIHVEAGLRSGDPREPFPEEFQRRLIDRLAWVHYAPTAGARENLLAEGCEAERVVVVGNTVVDAMRLALGRDPADVAESQMGPRRLLVTAHRRENFGRGIAEICEAIGRLIQKRGDLEVVYVLHPNPQARGTAEEALGTLPRVSLREPAGYREFLGLLADCTLVLTDSGGIQEEAPYLGKPVLVARNGTERPEAKEAGNAEVVGTDPDRICEAVGRLLDDAEEYQRRAARKQPFGDGRAAQRIREDLKRRPLTLP